MARARSIYILAWVFIFAIRKVFEISLVLLMRRMPETITGAVCHDILHFSARILAWHERLAAHFLPAS